MRKLILVVGCLSLFLAGWCFGQQTAWNGTMWKSLSVFERSLYAFGFNKGHVAGMRDGVDKTLAVIMTVKPPSSWTPEERRRLKEKADQIDQKIAANSDFTIGQLEGTISTFYDDYRNMPVCWNDAVAFSILSLEGSASTEKELNAARKQGAESGCR